MLKNLYFVHIAINFLEDIDFMDQKLIIFLFQVHCPSKTARKRIKGTMSVLQRTQKEPNIRMKQNSMLEVRDRYYDVL